MAVEAHPSELWVSIFQPFSLQQLTSMRLVCSRFRNIIDQTPELQIQMVFEHMMTMQLKCNIPVDNFKLHLQKYQLSVEVGDNLTLWKFVREPFQKALPWITRVIVKDAHPDEVKNLFWGLRESKRLRAVYLVNCHADPQTTLPEEKVIRVPPEQVEEYSFPRILTSDEDLIALEELCKQVKDDSAPAEDVLKTIEGVAGPITADIISSIWHSALMPLSGESQPKDIIQSQVFGLIAQDPHSSAVRAAADKSLEKLKRRSGSF